MKTLILFTCLFLPLSGFGKAAYHGKAEMIKQAEVIALVEITKVDSKQTKGKTWTYNEVASAKVHQVLKGELANEVKLYGKENFICAQVSYKPGKFLVFLRRDKELLVGVNWHLGVRPISGETIEWLDDKKVLNTKTQDLKTVLKEIETAVKTAP